MYVLCFVLVMSFLHYARFGNVMHALDRLSFMFCLGGVIYIMRLALVRSFMHCIVFWPEHVSIVPCFGRVIYVLCFVRSFLFYFLLRWSSKQNLLQGGCANQKFINETTWYMRRNKRKTIEKQCSNAKRDSLVMNHNF